MRPRTSAPRGITSTPPWNTGSSRTAMNVSPILFFSLFTLSIMRITTFDPVGIVQPVVAAFDDVGRVTRWEPGTNRGSGDVLFELVEGVVKARGDGAGAAAALSPPNGICGLERRS